MDLNTPDESRSPFLFINPLRETEPHERLVLLDRPDFLLAGGSDNETFGPLSISPWVAAKSGRVHRLALSRERTLSEARRRAALTGTYSLPRSTLKVRTDLTDVILGGGARVCFRNGDNRDLRRVNFTGPDFSGLPVPRVVPGLTLSQHPGYADAQARWLEAFNSRRWKRPPGHRPAQLTDAKLREFLDDIQLTGSAGDSLRTLAGYLRDDYGAGTLNTGVVASLIRGEFRPLPGYDYTALRTARHPVVRSAQRHRLASERRLLAMLDRAQAGLAALRAARAREAKP